MSKRFFTVLVLIVIGLGGVFWLTRGNANAPQSSASPTNHIYGEGKSGVTLTEYGDYQCPACGAYYPVVKSIVEKYKKDIFFQFRNFPLTQLHQNAFAGARAAEAADKQGKFWEMHDMLYEQQSSWSNSSSVSTIFEGYASQLGLNLDQFKQDYASTVVNDSINADVKQAEALGANGTPTFALNGQKIQNPADKNSFDKLIADAIASAKK